MPSDLTNLAFYIIMPRKNNLRKNNARFVDEEHHDEVEHCDEEHRDEDVHHYIQQLINSLNKSQSESHGTESNHLNNSASTNAEQGNIIVTINFCIYKFSRINL